MQNDITIVKGELAKFMETVSIPVVETREDFARAGDIGKQVSNKIKELEDKRLGMTRPLDDTKKQIMDEFKKITQPLEEFLGKTKQAMIAFQRKEEARIAEERRLLQEKQAEDERKRQEAIEAERKAAEAEGIPDLGEPMVASPLAVAKPAPVMPVAQKTERGQFATSTVKQNWQYEIIDADAVPRAYCEPSRDHIRQAILAGTREIPGVKIWDAGTVSIR